MSPQGKAHGQSEGRCNAADRPEHPLQFLVFMRGTRQRGLHSVSGHADGVGVQIEVQHNPKGSKGKARHRHPGELSAVDLAEAGHQQRAVPQHRHEGEGVELALEGQHRCRGQEVEEGAGPQQHNERELVEFRGPTAGRRVEVQEDGQQRLRRNGGRQCRRLREGGSFSRRPGHCCRQS